MPNNDIPYAIANLKGNRLAPSLTGTVKFYSWNNGTLVKAEVFNLPQEKIPQSNESPINPFGFHIHEGNTCGTNQDNDFEITGGHYNPTKKPHPFHLGDLPALFSNNGYAFMATFTNRFKPAEVLDRTVIIHLNPDDYRTQPAGNSGKRIACGVIKKYK